MNERKFMSNLKQSFLEKNLWATILVDGSDFSCRPFDMILNLNQMVSVEGKFQKSFSAFGMSQIRDSQRLNLDAVDHGWTYRIPHTDIEIEIKGKSFIALNIWIPHQENRLIIWPWQEFKERTTVSSYKKKELEAMPYIQGKKGRFPVDEILKVLHTSL